jgi:hypothetical protein
MAHLGNSRNWVSGTGPGPAESFERYERAGRMTIVEAGKYLRGADLSKWLQLSLKAEAERMARINRAYDGLQRVLDDAARDLPNHSGSAGEEPTATASVAKASKP